MLDILKNYKITQLEGKKISNYKLLSNSFGFYCYKIKTENMKNYVIKFSLDNKNIYNSILYEGKSLKFMYKKFPEFSRLISISNIEVGETNIGIEANFNECKALADRFSIIKLHNLSAILKFSKIMQILMIKISLIMYFLIFYGG